MEKYYYHSVEKFPLFCQKQSLLILVMFGFTAREQGTEVPGEPAIPRDGALGMCVLGDCSFLEEQLMEPARDGESNGTGGAAGPRHLS